MSVIIWWLFIWT